MKPYSDTIFFANVGHTADHNTQIKLLQKPNQADNSILFQKVVIFNEIQKILGVPFFMEV